MKTLYLIRHAKSDWKNPGLTDFERPLNKRGLRDLPLMKEKLADINFNPELAVCSPAQRTKTTAEVLAKNTSCLYDPAIYEATLNDLIFLINTLPNRYNEIALIGHNPSITSLSNYITENYIAHFPTCGVVKIELEIGHWNEIVQGIGIKKAFLYPKAFI